MAFALKKVPYFILFSGLFGATVTKCENADILKTIENLPNMTALYSTKSTYLGKNLQCATIQLTQIDEEKGTATYTWYLKTGDDKGKTFDDDIKATHWPQKVKVVSSPEPDTLWVATLPFTDANTCFILKRKGAEKVCILWVSNDSVDNPSEECIQENEKYCGPGVLLYSKDTCGRS